MRSSSRIIASVIMLGLPLGDALACGIEPFIGEICLFPYNFCPRGYAETNGQLLPIAQNTALFSLLGTTYGGNGQTTFALPDLRGRAPIGFGQGPGLSVIDLGEMLGTENMTLLSSNLPSHTHTATTTLSLSSQLKASMNNGVTDTPAGAVLARYARTNIYGTGPATTNMDGTAIEATGTAATTVNPTGNSQPFSLRNPALGLRFCIALEGIFPSRN